MIKVFGGVIIMSVLIVVFGLGILLFVYYGVFYWFVVLFSVVVFIMGIVVLMILLVLLLIFGRIVFFLFILRINLMNEEFVRKKKRVVKVKKLKGFFSKKFGDIVVWRLWIIIMLIVFVLGGLVLFVLCI